MFRHAPIQPPPVGGTPTIFYFVDNRLLVRLEGENAELADPWAPSNGSGLSGSTAGSTASDSAASGGRRGSGRIEVVRDLFLGMLDDKPCRVVELRVADEKSFEPWRSGGSAGTDGSGLSLMGIRSLLGRMDDELLKVAGVASQVLDWDRNHQFCGRCGTQTVRSETERSRSCPSCSLTAYPRISPAMIVAVLKGDKILLAHNRRHRASHVFSVLAGFVEPGESLEECVRREVMEEVSIKLGEIRYFASQPWPFPDSLMIAFTAEYESGDISVDGKEIAEADWFDKDHLPGIPPHGTVARRLIDWFVQSRSAHGASP